MSDKTHSRIAPEPTEAPEPQPVRTRDLVRGRALLHAWNTLAAGPIDFPSFVEAIQAYEDYRAEWDRRMPR
jgi:hypothetical protein